MASSNCACPDEPAWSADIAWSDGSCPAKTCNLSVCSCSLSSNSISFSPPCRTALEKLRCPGCTEAKMNSADQMCVCMCFKVALSHCCRILLSTKSWNPCG